VFAVALIWLFLFPELRRIRSFDEVPEDPGGPRKANP
jgi:hypothetical protein